MSDRLRTLLKSIGSRTVLMVPVEIIGVRGTTMEFDEWFRESRLG